MSSDELAIAVRGLGKAYTIRHQPQKHTTLADALVDRIRHPFRRPPKEVFWALQDVQFDVHKGEIVGVIGRNGSGKSTLLKLLSRITRPTRGEISLYGQVGSLLEVGTGFHQELTGRENVFLSGTILGMKHQDIKRQFDAIVDFAGVEQFLDTPVKRYSSGMYVRLAFAVAAHLNPEILLVDEVLAVGDAEFQDKCLGKIKDVSRNGRTVLFVSHNLTAVRNLCGRVILLSRGKVKIDGSPEVALEQYGLSLPDGARKDAHILFEAEEPHKRTNDVEVRRIEMVDCTGTPVHSIKTWQSINFRIYYRIVEPIRNMHLCIEISDVYERKLLSLETRTHSRRVDLGLADGIAEVSVAQMPLAPGAYTVGASAFVPDQRTLWSANRLGTLDVLTDDVFGLGHLPPSTHAAIITPHDWRFFAN